MSFSGQELFNLLPSYYRLKDTQLAQSTNLLTVAETTLLQSLRTSTTALTTTQQAQLNALTAKAARGPLQSLMMLIAEQVAAVEEDLSQLYDDEFIETCSDWVIPYIGDLIGYQSVHGVAAAVASPRAEVAHTISLRRRKGTILALEQLARDVTGWGAHAVEFFKLLSDTQYMNHIRLHNHYAPDLRSWKPQAYMDTGFDATAHTVDVRRIAVERGRYNIQNIGIFLWSINSYLLANSPSVAAPASPSGGICLRFNPLGRDMPLFNLPVSQGSDITAPANPSNVPDRLLRRVLCQDIQTGAGAVYYGAGKSLVILLNGIPVSPYQLQICNLSGPEGSWMNVPESGSPYLAAVDPEMGRISLPPAASGASAPTVLASFCYGFNGDMGGGPYPRNDQPADDQPVDAFAVQPEATSMVTQFNQSSSVSLLDALNKAIGNLSPPRIGAVALEINDNGIYPLVAETGVPLALNIPAGATFEFRAADGCRPTIVLGGELSVSGGANSSLYLNGLLVTYAPPTSGSPIPASLLNATGDASNLLGNLYVTHCTFVPGWALPLDNSPQATSLPLGAYFPALFAETPGLSLQIAKSILGTMWINGQVTASIADSIIDATDPTGVAYVASTDPSGQTPEPGGPLSLSGCTVIGKVYSSLLSLVTDSLFWASRSATDMAGNPPSWDASLWACQQQEGCIRFSYVPLASIVPRKYECVVEAVGSPQPVFVSLQYGDPGYCKLSPCTDDQIRRGADDGGEMGGFHFVLAPQRETDLSVRIQEYMPVNLEFGIFYQT